MATYTWMAITSLLSNKLRLFDRNETKLNFTVHLTEMLTVVNCSNHTMALIVTADQPHILLEKGTAQTGNFLSVCSKEVGTQLLTLPYNLREAGRVVIIKNSTTPKYYLYDRLAFASMAPCGQPFEGHFTNGQVLPVHNNTNGSLYIRTGTLRHILYPRTMTLVLVVEGPLDIFAVGLTRKMMLRTSNHIFINL